MNLSPSRLKAYARIDCVRDLQDERHGDHKHSVCEWIAVLQVQLDKAKTAWYNHGEPEAYSRIVDVAATAVAALEQQNAD
jgi:hypothetical protein